MFRIEKNVPPPSTTREGTTKYPFREMEIGDSFFTDQKIGTIASSAHHFAKKNPGYQFTVRKVEGGCRCWRVECT